MNAKRSQDKTKRSLVNTQLRQAEADMRRGSPDEVVAHAQAYLLLLDEYLGRLRGLEDVPRMGARTYLRWPSSWFVRSAER